MPLSGSTACARAARRTGRKKSLSCQLEGVNKRNNVAERLRSFAGVSLLAVRSGARGPRGTFSLVPVAAVTSSAAVWANARRWTRVLARVWRAVASRCQGFSAAFPGVTDTLGDSLRSHTGPLWSLFTCREKERDLPDCSGFSASSRSFCHHKSSYYSFQPWEPSRRELGQSWDKRREI